MTIAPLSIVLLVASLVAIFAGPALHHVLRSRRSVLCGLDGFVLVAVMGLVLLHVVPEAIRAAGWAAALAAVLGLFGPSLTERRLARVARQAHSAALLFALVGVVLHSVFDGVALAGWTPGAPDEQTMLAAAVILHQIPVGLTVWLLLRPRHGARLPLTVLAVTAVAVIAGFVLGDALREASDSFLLGILQAFVGGSLLHVIMHSGIEHEGVHEGGLQRGAAPAAAAAGFGALAGGGLVFLLSLGGDAHGHGAVECAAHAAAHDHGGFAATFLALASESAPALLLGYAAAGLVSVLLPQGSLRWLARGGPATQALRGVAFGLPLPVCSCGVVPLYRSLVVRGAPATAAMAFLVATPELGLDAVLLSVPLLGVPLAAARVVAAGLVALVVGWVVGRLVDRAGAPPAPAVDAAPALPRGALPRLRLALHNGFGETFEATAPWILLGLAVAAVADPLLEGRLTELPAGLDVPLLALLGLPLYICASGATPLVAVLIHQGVSPGAAIALLLTGPATNVTTFGLLTSLHGRKVALAFGGLIVGLAVALGYLANTVLPAGVPFSPEAHEHGPTALQVVSLALLGAAFVVALIRRGPRALIEVVIPPSKHAHAAEQGPGDEHGPGHEHAHGDEHGHEHEHGEREKVAVAAPAAACCSSCHCGAAETGTEKR